MRRMIVIAFFQQLAVLSSAFMRNIDLLATHSARKRNLFVKKYKELKLSAVLLLA